MVLDHKVIKQIESFVKIRPRTVSEIALLVNKNWRTADSYVKKIMAEQGSLDMHTFREGSRGALKVVYFASSDTLTASALKERLLSSISVATSKEDFNPFDIYQHVSKDSRRAFLEKQTELEITEKQGLANALRSAETQVLIFSGNLSWAVTKQGSLSLLSLLEELILRKIVIKIICNVDLESLDNINRILSLNNKHNTDLVEIRHAEQPLRAFVVDSKFARFKQHKKLDTFIFYELTDKEWVDWVQKLFWHLFRTSISAERRIEDLKSIDLIS